MFAGSVMLTGRRKIGAFGSRPPSGEFTAEHYLHVYSDRDADAADAFGRLIG
jgi:hypothetical protein